MDKTLTSAILFSTIILLISILIITVSPGIHEKKLLTPQSIENDQIFSNYFQTGNTLELANVEGITEDEVTHMFDVRRILIIASIVVFIIGIILLIFWDSIENLYPVFLAPLLIIWISLPTIIFTNFDKLFSVFHKVLFPQGNYSFPIDSILITTYPIEFFINMSFEIVKIYLCISVGFLFIKAISDKIYLLIQRL